MNKFIIHFKRDSFEWPPTGGSGSGTVSSVSIVSANGFAGTVANPTTTPAITLTTTVTGILQGNGTAISAATIGNLTEATSSVLTIVGGTNAVLGSGASIQVKQAGTSQSGYLSATDWNTFNGKQASGNYITALTGDGSAAGPGSAALTLATVNSNTGTFASVTVNGKGLVTAAAALSGDATTSGAALTLATVNLNIGTFASATVNGKGLVTAAAALSGDATTSGSALTLATVNTNTGSFGSSSAIPSFTVNGKGLMTAATTNAVVAPAGTLSGTTLNSTVVTSSLTAVGTLGTGVWQGTPVGTTYGGLGGNFGSSTGVITISSGTISASSLPGNSTFLKAPTVQRFTSSTGTYTTPTSPAPLYIIAELVGGGGGGGAGGSSGNGGGGGPTTFGTSFLTAGAGATAGSQIVGGSGGTNTINSGGVTLDNIAGQGGGSGGTQLTTEVTPGGIGGSGGKGGGGGSSAVSGNPGGAGAANSGGGGGGGGGNSGLATNVGGGGGGGGYVRVLITSPAATYSYAVGAGGAGGTSGGSGQNGGAGGSGVIVVTEHYQ